MKKFNEFMYNRYGIDELYNFLFKVYLIIFLLNIFIKSKVLNCIEIVLVVIIFYRFFSKNKYKRNIENNIYLNIKNRINNKIKNIYTKYKDGYIYKKCPKCKKMLKLPLPYKKGIKTAICPKCNKKFKMLVIKCEKIEFVKK